MELEQLIETERRNDERVRQARAEAMAIVAAAEALVAEREQALATEVQQLMADHVVALEREHQERLTALNSAAKTDIARYRDLDDTRLQRIVAKLFEEFLGGQDVT